MELYDSYKYCKLFGDTTRASRYFNEKLALNRESSNNINRMNKHRIRKSINATSTNPI